MSAQYALSSVALAVAVTAGVAGSLAAYAARTKTDYTARGGMLLSALTALLLTGLLSLFVRSSAAELMLAGVGAVLFSAYIVFDVQLLIGGQHAKFQLRCGVYVARCLQPQQGMVCAAARAHAPACSCAQPTSHPPSASSSHPPPPPTPSPDDYVAGTIALYLDIVNLFLHLLRLLGSERE